MQRVESSTVRKLIAITSVQIKMHSNINLNLYPLHSAFWLKKVANSHCTKNELFHYGFFIKNCGRFNVWKYIITFSQRKQGFKIFSDFDTTLF